MRTIYWLLIPLLFACSPKRNAMENTPDICGAYTVTKTSAPETWAGPQFFISQGEKTDEFLLQGFSNMGVTAKGEWKQGALVFPQQSHTVVPFGGEASESWEVTLSGKMSPAAKGVSLQYRIQYPDETTARKGEVQALKK